MTNQSVFKSEEGKNAIIKVYDSILDRWPVPYETLNIPTSYGNTFIIACGEKSAPPLILLHGTSSNSAMWIGDVSEYSRYYRVYAVDIPGEPGKSEAIRYEVTGPAHTEWLDEIFEALKIDQAVLLGLSFGGWIAAKYASAHPERVVKLVLLCPSGISPQKISFMFKVIPLMFCGEWGLNKIVGIVNGNQSVPDEVVSYSKLISSHFNPRVVVIPLLTDEELKRLKMPVLLIVGAKDALLHSKKTAARMRKVLPHASVVLLPGVGHVLIDQINRIMDFLEPGAGFVF